MLPDPALRNLKPKGKPYKLADREGLYACALKSGTISFRYNYSINGRQETLVLGQYGPHGRRWQQGARRLGRKPTRRPGVVRKQLRRMGAGVA